MVISDLFAMLSYGELSNLAMSNDGNGTIIASSQPKIVQYANEALLRLYSRFVLKENDLIIEMQEWITFYHLTPPYAVTYTPPAGTASQPVRYIMDIPSQPFLGDVIKVMAVFDSEGENLPLNDDAQMFSVFTPQVNVLQVPQPVYRHSSSVSGVRYITVLYQARHAKLLGDLQEEICIPDIILGAFTSYIAYKVFSHMNTTDSTAKAQEYLGMYESICADVTDRDLVNSSISTSNESFHERGWI